VSGRGVDGLGAMSDPTDRLGTALADRYRLERELGEGGMATVYLAEDLKHDRRVAIKVLKPELAAVLGAERFLQEIKTTAGLQHPHILPLYGASGVGAADEGLSASSPRSRPRRRCSIPTSCPSSTAVRPTASSTT